MDSRSQRRRRRLSKTKVQGPENLPTRRTRKILFWLITFHALASIVLASCMLMLSKSDGMAIIDGLLDLPILVSVILTLLVFALFPIAEITVWARRIRLLNGKVGISNLHANNAKS